jgi:hypothetical protein
VNSFFKETRVLVRETLSRAPQSPQKISPNAHQGNPVYDTGAWVHKSYGLCAELWVRKKRTAARTCRANRRTRLWYASLEPMQKTNPVYDTGARVHESCSVGASFWVRELPHAVAHFFISAARDNSPVYDTGAQAHRSYSLGAGSRVRKERTAKRAGSAPPRGRGRTQKVIF